MGENGLAHPHGATVQGQAARGLQDQHHPQVRYGRGIHHTRDLLHRPEYHRGRLVVGKLKLDDAELVVGEQEAEIRLAHRVLRDEHFFGHPDERLLDVCVCLFCPDVVEAKGYG